MQKEEIRNIINKYKELADATPAERADRRYQIVRHLEDNFQILEDDIYQKEWDLLDFAFKKMAEENLKTVFADYVYFVNEKADRISLSVRLNNGEIFETKEMNFTSFYFKLPELLDAVEKREKELLDIAFKKQIEEKLKKVFADYVYFTNKTPDQIALFVRLNNGKIFETASMTYQNFYDELPDLLNSVMDVERFISKSKFKFNLTQPNNEAKLRFKLEQSAPSKLKLNSYSELCEYCSKSENFENYNVRDILEIISAAEKFFLLRLNELAELHDLPKAKEIIVDRERRAWGRCDYRGKLIWLNINLLCYSAIDRETTFVHELCHFIVHDHSKDFYNLLYSKVEKNCLEEIENKKLRKIFAQFYDSKTGKKKELVKYFQEK